MKTFRELLVNKSRLNPLTVTILRNYSNYSERIYSHTRVYI